MRTLSACLVNRSSMGETRSISEANSIPFASSSSAGTISLTKPIALARSALKEAACEQQLGGDGKTDQPGQQVTRSHVAAADTDADIGSVHPGIWCGEADIAGQQEGKTRAARRAVNEPDDRLRTRPHQTDDAGVVLLHLELALRSSLAGCSKGVRSEFSSGGELGSVASQNHDARGRPIVQRREVVGQFPDHVGRDGVELVGAVQCQDLDRAAGLQGNGVRLRHGCPPIVHCL